MKQPILLGAILGVILSIVLFLAWSLADGRKLEEKLEKNLAEATYVEVTIKGKLEVTGEIVSDWNKFLQKDTTGLQILSPGSTDLFSFFGWGFPEEDATGLRWRLFLGEDQALHNLAVKLKNKTVIVSGRLEVIATPSHPVGGNWVPLLAVRVKSMKAG